MSVGIIKPIKDFIRQFGSSMDIDESLVVRKQNRYFLVSENLKNKVQRDFFYAGLYLGKVKGARFFPSFVLLTMIAEKKANKVTVDKKTEWLFICGRDIFKRGILNVTGSRRKGDYALIQNEYDECLGFGKIFRNISEEKDKNNVLVKNILDIGDFLRREKSARFKHKK